MRMQSDSINRPSDAQMNGVIFFLVLSLLWTIEVLRNTIHTTTAGVCGTFYFFGASRNATLKSARRTLTTTFGAVCLGSLIVSIVATLRVMVNRRRDRRRDTLANVCLDCLLRCIEDIIRYVSKFAFTRVSHCSRRTRCRPAQTRVQVAVYGESFMTACRATFELFRSRGLDVVIADDLSSFALVAGSLLGGAFAALLGGISALALSRNVSCHADCSVWHVC